MQNRRFRFLRVFAVLAVLLSAMGSLSLSASAAPLNMASPDRDTYQAAASMTGQVLSTLGDPIVGATVVIEETGQSTTSVDGGYYAIGGVPNGDYTVTASAVGFEPQSVSASIVDGTNGVANFALVPVGASVAGQVTDANSGAGIVGATVCVDGTDLCTTSVDGGYYAIGGVPNGEYTVTASAYGYESQSAGASVVGGVNASANFALVPVGASVAGQVFDDAGNPIVGATIAINETGQSTTSVDGGYYAIGGVVNGEYTVTASAYGYESQTLGASVVGGVNATVNFNLVPVGASIAGQVFDEDGNPIVGATVIVNETGQSATSVDGGYYAIGGVVNGTYTVTASADGYEAVTLDATVAGATVTLDFTLPTVAPPVATTGFVEVYKAYCDDVDGVVFNGDDIDDDCVPGPATFTFYLVGDGTAEYWQLDVWEDGFGSIELAAGTYEVVEEGTQATTTIEVVADATTVLTVANPGEAPAPRNGTVNVSTFSCTNIDTTIFSSDSPAILAAAGLPTFEPACEPVTTDVTFYLVGDGTADYWQITTTGGAGSIELAPGTYEVVEESTQTIYFLEVLAGDVVNLDIQIPAGGEVVPGSSVNVVKFYCENVTDVEFLSLSGSEYSERDELAGAPECLPGYAVFTFYLVGDGTAEYAQLEVSGAASIGLEPGIYEVVEEGTQARFTFEVFDGENTILLVNNPMPEDGEVPVVPDDGDDDDDNGTDDGKKDDGKKDDGKKDDDKKVTGLPSTGSGMSNGTGLLTIAAAAAAAISGAGALAVRKER